MVMGGDNINAWQFITERKKVLMEREKVEVH